MPRLTETEACKIQTPLELVPGDDRGGGLRASRRERVGLERFEVAPLEEPHARRSGTPATARG